MKTTESTPHALSGGMPERAVLRFFVFAYWHDQRFKNEMGGPIKVYELTDNLAKRGHRVLLFIPRLGFPERQTSADVRAVPFVDLPIIRFLSYQILAFLWAICIALRNDRPDIIYVRIMWSFVPMLLGKIFSVPVILEVNDSPQLAYQAIVNPLKRAAVHKLDRISFHWSDHILPVTRGIAEQLHLREHVPCEKMTVMPSGTNIDLFRPLDKATCAAKIHLDPSPLYVGFIGTLFRHQGIDILIDSAPLMIKKYPGLKFLLLGDGPMRHVWQERIAETGLKQAFIMPGNIPYTEVPLYCALMDVCVAPYTKEAAERSPVKIFDYLACGRPVVSGDAGETISFFKDSGAVVIVPLEDPVALADGILLLLGNESLRREMGERGRTFIAANYSRASLARLVEMTALRLHESFERNPG